MEQLFSLDFSMRRLSGWEGKLLDGVAAHMKAHVSGYPERGKSWEPAACHNFFEDINVVNLVLTCVCRHYFALDAATCDVSRKRKKENTGRSSTAVFTVESFGV
jgi:hypothetical protein